MDYLPVIIVVALILAACIARRCIKFSEWIKKNEPFLDFLEIIGVVGLVLSLSITISQFRKNEQKQAELKHEQFISRLSTLEAEIQINIHICTNELLKSYESRSDDEALPVPQSRFHTAILEQTLSQGDIVRDELRNKLWNAYRLMSTANDLLTQAVLIRHTEHIADPRDLMLIQGRREKVNDLVEKAMDFVKKSEPLLNESKKALEEIKEVQQSK